MSHWIHLSITLLLHALDSFKGEYLDLHTPHLSLKSSLSSQSELSLHISLFKFYQNFFPDALHRRFGGDCFPVLFLVGPSFFFASCLDFLFSSSINFVCCFCSLAFFLSSFSFSFLDLVSSFSLYNAWCSLFVICDSPTFFYNLWFVRLFVTFTTWQVKYIG